MKQAALALTTESKPFTENSQQRALAGLPSYDVQVGIRFTPVDNCQLVHNTLCLTVTCDSREENQLRLQIGEEYVELIDISFVSSGQRLRIPLSPAATVLLNKHDLYLKSDKQLWIAAQQAGYPYLRASLASSQEPADYLSRLCDSGITQFGWMLGCVLDGLLALHQQQGEQRFRDALDRYLGYFLRADGLNYENPRNEISVNDFHSIELTLPMAVICQLYPQHPAIDLSIAFLRSRRIDSGLIYDGASITAEGCYTIAYPLMHIGQQRQDQELIEWSWQQLAIRRQALWRDGGIYLRNYDEKKSFHHWARGVCWYFLGLIRTQIASRQEPNPQQLAHICEIAEYVASFQNAQHLWYNFFDDASKPIDSSGSAGISCALALAAKRQWIDDSYRQRAQRCLTALQLFIVDGGFLSSVAPNNKRGEEYQRGEKRTCEPLALGLLGQLHAALL